MSEKLGAEQGRWRCETCDTVYAEYINGCPHCWEAGIRSGVRFVGIEQAYHARGAGREALRECVEALDSIWAAIGDALCSGKGIEKAYANAVANETRQASDKAKAALRGQGADAGTTPRRDQFIFDKDAGGNSVFTRLEAEVAFNRDKPEHEMATDTSLSQGDLRKILKAFRRQGDFTDALRGTTPPTEGQMKRTAEQVVSEWRSIGSTDWGQLVSAINYWAITDMCPALRGTTPPEGLREVAFEEVRVMLEEQKTECLADPRYKDLNRMRADELDNALINLRALAATQRAPVEQAAPQPWGYAYRYPDGIHVDTGGREINGNKPIEAIPLYLGASAPDHARERATMKCPKCGVDVFAHGETCPVSREGALREAAVEEYKKSLDVPELEDFAKGLVIEAQHQRQRWGDEHDKSKEPEEWFWLVGYLAGKGLRSQRDGDMEKFKHHLITGAAVLANWHARVKSQRALADGKEGGE